MKHILSTLGFFSPLCVFAACKAGFYKAFAGNIKCSKCPPHSFSHSEASALCHCEKGYYRAGKDPPSTACTRQFTSIYLIICLDSVIVLFSARAHATQSYISSLLCQNHSVSCPSIILVFSLCVPVNFFLPSAYLKKKGKNLHTGA